MLDLNLNVEVRNIVGKGASRKARVEGKVPISMFGDNKDPISLEISLKELLLHLESNKLYTDIYTVKSEKNKINQEVLIRNVQYHPVTDVPMHVDMLRVGAKTVTRLNVPVVLLNQSACKGIKFGGVLNWIAHTLEIACNPKNAPEKIEIDLLEVEVGTVIKIEDIKLPKGVKTYYAKGYPIASINAASSEEEDKSSESVEEEVSEE